MHMCTDLSIDAMDVSGEHQLDVLHSVFKTRLSEKGEPVLEDTEKLDLGDGGEGEGGVDDSNKEPGNEVKEVKIPEKCGR